MSGADLCGLVWERNEDMEDFAKKRGTISHQSLKPKGLYICSWYLRVNTSDIFSQTGRMSHRIERTQDWV